MLLLVTVSQGSAFGAENPETFVPVLLIEKIFHATARIYTFLHDQRETFGFRYVKYKRARQSTCALCERCQ